jgi:uncharacterized repeat protein (TIGR01451 family)
MGKRQRVLPIVLIATFGFALCTAKASAVDFATPKSYPVGTNPKAIVIADFNGDGKPDIAVANSGSHNVSVLLGNGDGTFQPAVTFEAGNSPTAIAVGDFNADGKVDLAVFQPGNSQNFVAGSVSVLLGNGDGSFRAPQTMTLTSFASQMAVADFNLDKKSDLAVSSVDSSTGTAVGTLSIFLGKGDGSFQPAKAFSVPPGPDGSFAVADFNEDGKPDLAIASWRAINVFLGSGNGTFQQATTVSVAADLTPNSILSVDLNHDGKVDLVVRSSGSDPNCGGEGSCSTFKDISVFLGNGNGSFQGELLIATGSSFIGFGTFFGDVVLSDFNGDGKLDVAYQKTTITGGPAFHSSTFLEVRLGRGDGSFSPAIRALEATGLPFEAVAVAGDFDANKLSDLVVLQTANNSIAVALNTSPTTGADLGVIQSGASPEPVGIATNLTYTADVLNEGPENATGAMFTDTLPNGVSFVSASATQGSCIQSHGIVTCNLGSLASAFDAVATIVVAPTATGTITNTMSVTATEPDLVSANNSATQNTTVVPVFTLTVAKAGTGSGTVTSSPIGIDCGGVCSQGYVSGASVSLTATASGSSAFGGWSGACTGTDPYSCAVTLNSDQAVTATFDIPPDFSLTPAATSLTMQRGGQVSDVLTFLAQGGFSGSIALVCSVAGPAPMPTCGVSPASVTPGTNATLTVNSAALSASLTAPWFEQGARLYAAWLPLELLAYVLATGFDKERRRLSALCLLMLAVAILPTACGGGSSTSIKGPPLQNFTVTVTATSGAIQHSTNVIVTVQ